VITINNTLWHYSYQLLCTFTLSAMKGNHSFIAHWHPIKSYNDRCTASRWCIHSGQIPKFRIVK